MQSKTVGENTIVRFNNHYCPELGAAMALGMRVMAVSFTFYSNVHKSLECTASHAFACNSHIVATPIPTHQRIAVVSHSSG